jgi:putative DNA primase/helicase
MSGLRIPPFTGDEDNLTAALAYAEAGWYLGPLRLRSGERQGKNPGNYLGDDWDQKTSRNPEVITAWFIGRDDLGVFLHVGRSGGWVADIDKPAKIPDVLERSVSGAPFQATRPTTDPTRGHYVFTAPAGRRLGNSTGKLGGGWGEARGRNGVIVVWPTRHPGRGRYLWRRTGPCPVLPAEIADLLPNAGETNDAVTDGELTAFITEHTRADRPELLKAVTNAFTTTVAEGESRHDAAVNCACWAMREAACGLYPALDAAVALRDLYITARGTDRTGGRNAVDEHTARDEFRSIVAWAIGQVDGEDLNELRRKIDTRAPDRDDRTPTEPRKPGFYFKEKLGLLVATLATDVIAMGPLAEGADDIVWSYSDGVWSPDHHVVRRRTADLLGQRYRRGHGTNTEDVVRARVPRIACNPVPEVINFRNGLYLWQADQLRDHSPDVLSTVQLAVDWNPEATCPTFDTWLAQVVPADMIPTMWELVGYLMYSGNPLHKAVMLMGSGRNGKGTYLRVVNAVLGARNVTSVSLHDLVNTRFSTVSLFGKIANIAGDIDATYLESTATFKAVTGQDRISAEHKGRDRFDFTPWAVPVFSANKVPPSVDVTTGYLSRWLVVPFPNDFTGREDRTLDRRLHTKAELQGIAVKAMPALRRLLERGDFTLPESGQQARDEFTRRVDQVRTWVADCCEIGDPDRFTLRTLLYRDYKAWTQRDGYKPVRAGEFYDRLDTIPGVVPTRRGQGDRGYTGIRVSDHAYENTR